MQQPSVSLAHHTALRQSGHEAPGAAYSPLPARQGTARTVLLDAGTTDVIGYLPLDSF